MCAAAPWPACIMRDERQGCVWQRRHPSGRMPALPGMAAPTVALELYTVRDELERPFAGTLRRVAAMGYPAVEGGHYRTIETGVMKALLDETGLQVPAVLFGLPALEADLDAEIDYCRAIGSSYLVLSWVHPAQLAG